MNFKKWLIESAAVFTVVLIVSVMVTLLWNVIAHRAGTVDWESSLRFAITFAIVLPWVGVLRRPGK